MCPLPMRLSGFTSVHPAARRDGIVRLRKGSAVSGGSVSGRSDRRLIVAIVSATVATWGLILATDDGAKIDALDARLSAKIDALDAKLSAKIDAGDARLNAKIDALDAKVDDIRVYIAAKHGERVTFTPGTSGREGAWSVRTVDAVTGKPRQIGTLEIQGGSERRAVLHIGEGKLTREWTHLGNVDTLDRARALTLFATVPVENR